MYRSVLPLRERGCTVRSVSDRFEGFPPSCWGGQWGAPPVPWPRPEGRA